VGGHEPFRAGFEAGPGDREVDAVIGPDVDIEGCEWTVARRVPARDGQETGGTDTAQEAPSGQ
jgi:hypothetical protein